MRHIVEYLVQANGSNGLPIGGGSRGGRRGAPPVAAACGCGGRRGGAENETATRCSTKCARGGDDKSGVGVVKGKQVPEWVPQFKRLHSISLCSVARTSFAIGSPPNQTKPFYLSFGSSP